MHFDVLGPASSSARFVVHVPHGSLEIPAEFCIGVEDAHDRPRLRSRWAEEARGRGLTVGYNEPFAGSLVPSKFHRTDARVTSLMIELRRDLYMDEATGRRAARYAEIEGFVRALFAAAAESPA